MYRTVLVWMFLNKMWNTIPKFTVKNGTTEYCIELLS